MKKKTAHPKPHPRPRFDVQASFDAIRGLLGEHAHISIREREATREVLDDFSRRLEKALGEKKLAFVWGVGEVLQGERVSRATIGTEPVWMSEGGKETFWIESYAPVRNIRLRVEPPFMIRDVCLGNQMQTLSHSGMYREVEFSEPLTPGTRLRVNVEWLSERGQ